MNGDNTEELKKTLAEAVESIKAELTRFGPVEMVVGKQPNTAVVIQGYKTDEEQFIIEITDKISLQTLHITIMRGVHGGFQVSKIQ